MPHPPLCDLLLSAENLRFSVPQGEHELSILRGIHFKARAGEFVGIVGSNGAGKTTLLKALAGFLPVQGEVTLAYDGAAPRPLRAYSARELARTLCYMHQDTVVPFAFTVREVIALGRQPWLGRFSSPSAADGEKINVALHLAGCEELADRCVQELSGGERQRVMLARALAQDTPVLLLDEPTASLDIRHTQHVFHLCRELAAQGRCVVAVLHDLRQAAGVCTRLCLLHDGSVVADGAPTQVLTAAHMERAYRIHAHVFDNPAGQWDYFVEE